MNLLAQVIPLVLVLVWLAIGIYVLTLIVRFVQAHERIATALERTATELRRKSDVS